MLCLFWDVAPALLPLDTDPFWLYFTLFLVLLFPLVGLVLFATGSWVLLPRLFPMFEALVVTVWLLRLLDDACLFEAG